MSFLLYSLVSTHVSHAYSMLLKCSSSVLIVWFLGYLICSSKIFQVSFNLLVLLLFEQKFVSCNRGHMSQWYQVCKSFYVFYLIYFYWNFPFCCIASKYHCRSLAVMHIDFPPHLADAKIFPNFLHLFQWRLYYLRISSYSVTEMPCSSALTLSIALSRCPDNHSPDRYLPDNHLPGNAPYWFSCYSPLMVT